MWLQRYEKTLELDDHVSDNGTYVILHCIGESNGNHSSILPRKPHGKQYKMTDNIAPDDARHLVADADASMQEKKN